MTTNNLRSLTSRLGLKLLAAEASQPKNLGKNVTIAPISIATALSMAAVGAQGQTYEQMRSVMGLTTDDGDYSAISSSFARLISQLKTISPADGQLALAQSIWKRTGTAIGPDFYQQIVGDFASEVWEFNPAYADNLGALNAWVAKATADNIPEMLKVFNPEALMFLVSAVWFKAPWKDKFDPSQTRSQNFLARGLTAYSRPHPHMHKKGAYLGFSSAHYRQRNIPLVGFDGLDFDGASLSFGQKGRLQHVAIVPTNGASVNDLLDALARAPDDSYGFLGTNVDFGTAVGEILLPRYEADYGNNLKDSLSSLGMPDAFTNGVADFGRMLPHDQVFIGSVEHKAKLTINEEGGEGSGATVIDMTRESVMVPMKLDVAFDRPFISAIVDTMTDAALFLSVVNDPVDPGLAKAK